MSNVGSNLILKSAIYSLLDQLVFFTTPHRYHFLDKLHRTFQCLSFFQNLTVNGENFDFLLLFFFELWKETNIRKENARQEIEDLLTKDPSL
jgi:hypothetical protein